MTLTFDSLQTRTIREVHEWYRFQDDILAGEKARLLQKLARQSAPADSRFFGMTREGLETYFDEHGRELDFLAMFDLMAAAEAAIQLDLLHRVRTRRKDAVSRRLREHRRQAPRGGPGTRVDLEADILDVWADAVGTARKAVSDFKGALKLRHWLAHGRYWTPKMGRRQYSPDDIYDICHGLLQVMQSTGQKVTGDRASNRV